MPIFHPNFAQASVFVLRCFNSDIMDSSSTQQLMAQAWRQLGIDPYKHYNLAIVGQSGVGKSSLINAIRLIKDNHPDAAPVGETETTASIKKYHHPTNSAIVLWDVPGAGTFNHADFTYFSDKMLYAFDCILVVTSDRFLQVDFEIAMKAKEQGKPCAFVRTKAELAVKSIAERMRKQMGEASKELRRKADDSLQKGLRDTGFSGEAIFPLFIVSAWAFTRPNAYSLYRYKAGVRDTSLEKMDEDELKVFMANLVKAWEKQMRN